MSTYTAWLCMVVWDISSLKCTMWCVCCRFDFVPILPAVCAYMQCMQYRSCGYISSMHVVWVSREANAYWPIHICLLGGFIFTVVYMHGYIQLTDI